MTHVFSRKDYDAVVVGARCAGAATAMLLARMGSRVLLVERDPNPGDTISTHALMGPAITLLDGWGLLPAIASADTPAVRQVRFVYGRETVDIPIAPQAGAEGLYAPRRTVLDKILRDAAVAAGAEYRPGAAFEDVRRDAGGRVTGALLRSRSGARFEVPADIVIGADGRRSAVAEAVGAPVRAEAAASCATIYGYVPGLPNEGYRWFFASGIAIWEPRIAEAVRAAPPRLRRYNGALGHIRDCAGVGWALVSDACYFKDLVTAHGITDSPLDAGRLANALSRTGGAASYQSARDAHAPAMLALTHRIATLDASMDNLNAMHRDLAGLTKTEGAALAADLDLQPRAA